MTNLDDPVAAFIRAACVPRDGSHASGTLEEAELILERHPQVARASIHTCAIRADEAGVRKFLNEDPNSARAKGGPYEWDPLTYLCFSRYLRLEKSRSDGCVRTARALLEAGAPANTGWYEMIDHPTPRPILESAIYGAAGVAHHAGLTRLLLEFGADPNDEETPYHAAEAYDQELLRVLLESGRLDKTSVSTLLLRKADCHDVEGLRLLLEHGADPNAMTRWGQTALHQALRRDNALRAIALLLDDGGDPALRNERDGRSGTEIAAQRGRGDVLGLLRQRGIPLGLDGMNRLIAACAEGEDAAVRASKEQDIACIQQVLSHGGVLLAEFAGNGNTAGVQRLLDLGVDPGALFLEGDGYWDLAKNSTALHSAAWRMWPQTVHLLVERGTPVNARDAKGRTALMLAVKACVDSYWINRRTPEVIEALLNAGPTLAGIQIPCGYDAVDHLLGRAKVQAM